MTNSELILRLVEMLLESEKEKVSKTTNEQNKQQKD